VTFDTAAFEVGAIAADAVALAELHGGTGHEQVRIEWLQRRLEHAPGSRSVDNVGNLVWTFGPPPYRLAVLVHVDDVFDAATVRGITQRDGWLCGPGIGDNAIAVATTVAVAERVLARPGGSLPVAVVFTVGEFGRPADCNRGRFDRRERGAGGRHTGGRPRLLPGRGHARADRTNPRRHYRHRCRATARRPGRGPS
jgi:hypothetical protein